MLPAPNFSASGTKPGQRDPAWVKSAIRNTRSLAA